MNTLFALLAGVATGLGANWALQFLLPQLSADTLFTNGLVTSGDTSWRPALHGAVLALSWLAPGFVTGLFARRNGIVLGLTTALMLAFLSLFVSVYFMLKSGASILPLLGPALHAVVLIHLPIVICSAVAGGCAQNMRGGGGGSGGGARNKKPKR